MLWRHASLSRVPAGASSALELLRLSRETQCSQTYVRLFSSVQPQVLRQVALLSELKVAVLTDKRLLSTVQKQVPC